MKAFKAQGGDHGSMVFNVVPSVTMILSNLDFNQFVCVSLTINYSICKNLNRKYTATLSLNKKVIVIISSIPLYPYFISYEAR